MTDAEEEEIAKDLSRVAMELSSAITHTALDNTTAPPGNSKIEKIPAINPNGRISVVPRKPAIRKASSIGMLTDRRPSAGSSYTKSRIMIKFMENVLQPLKCHRTIPKE
jgi:hypothetical protein